MVKASYKQTEVGLIPVDWDVKRLGDLGKVARGGSPRPAGDPRYFNGDFIPWLTVAALTTIPEHQLVVNETASHLTEEGSLRSRVVDEGTLIIANSGATLGVAKLLGIRCCANDGIAVILNQRRGHKPFLCFYINTQTTNLREVVATGNGQPNLNTGLIREIRVPFPQETEQRAIASALSDVDGLLGALDRLIVKKRDLKQAVIQQLLTGQTRLPGFSGKWQLRRLGDHVNFLKTGSHSKAMIGTDGPVHNLHYGEIHATTGIYIDPRCLPTLRYDQCARLDRLQHGDLVLADASEDRDGVGKSIEISDERETQAVAGLHTIAARFDKSILADGYKGLLQYCRPFTNALRSLAAGTKVYATMRSHVASVEMKLPPAEEQVAIAVVFREIDLELAALEERRTKTRVIKHGMMQELLTGRTRLVKPLAPDLEDTATSQETKGHNWAFNEAVVIATLVKHFGKDDFPLGRKRYTKLSYLLHRHAERVAEGYLKKAAGPYNPQTKYGGPEKIAQQNGYIKQHKGPKGHSGFIADDSVTKAEAYFEKWYGSDVIRWLEQFRFKKNDELEVLATVDMAVQDLRSNGKSIDVASVKDVIDSHPEWKAKLDRLCFADHSIDSAIQRSEALFG